MGYSGEVRPKVFYGKKKLNTKEGDSLAARLAKETSSSSAASTLKWMRKNMPKRVPKRNKQEEDQEVDLLFAFSCSKLTQDLYKLLETEYIY